MFKCDKSVKSIAYIHGLYPLTGSLYLLQSIPRTVEYTVFGHDPHDNSTLGSTFPFHLVFDTPSPIAS